MQIELLCLVWGTLDHCFLSQDKRLKMMLSLDESSLSLSFEWLLISW